ncbi:hypothetical protein N7534_005305 [Penicillium rubens]|nr:hypothetical protein N7534_005305 [Penicillium rubens]
MPARAHRRAPRSPRRRRQPPTPHAGGSLQWPPGGAGLLCTPPTKAPREGGPLRPPTPSRSANWRICKIAISSAPVAGLHRPPPKPRLPKPREGAPAPCVHPAPRASRSAARFARRLRLHLTPSTSPAGAANSPAAPTGAPRPPSQGREAPPAAPRPGAGGGGTAGGARLRGDRRAGGSYREGHPARAPTVTSPAIPAPPTQRDAATLAGPHSLSPGPLGPGRFYTDSPTPFGV